MGIKAVVFDIGGVLEITPPVTVFERWEKRLGHSDGYFEKKIQNISHAGAIGTITEAEYRLQFGEILQLDQSQVNLFMDEMWAEYLGTLNVELTQYLNGLRANYKTGIISNSFVGAREREQELYGFENMTDLIIYSHEVGICKPDHKIYELTCERLDIKPQEMVFVDDLQENVDSASVLGIQAVLFTSTDQAIADVERLLR